MNRVDQRDGGRRNRGATSDPRPNKNSRLSVKCENSGRSQWLDSERSRLSNRAARSPKTTRPELERIQ